MMVTVDGNTTLRSVEDMSLMLCIESMVCRKGMKLEIVNRVGIVHNESMVESGRNLLVLIVV